MKINAKEIMTAVLIALLCSMALIMYVLNAEL